MNNKILSTLNIGNNSYEIDDAFARQKIEEVDNNLLKINPVYSTSGSVVSFDDGADNLPLEELIVDINPVQDLHGYDHPWIGGGGKNLLKNELVTSTISGITATVDEEGIVTLNGTATEVINFKVTTDIIVLPSKDSYIISGGADGGGTDTYRLYFEYYNYDNEEWNGTTCNSTNQERVITTDQFRNFKIQIFKDAVCDNVVFKPMLRKATETDATFEPYENICPISGWTNMNIQHTGVNVWDEEWELGSLDNTTGEKTNSTVSIRSKNFIPVFPNTQYYFPNMDGYVLQYDKNKQYIGLLTNRNTAPTDPNCYFLMFRLSTNYGIEYKNDYSINYPATIMEYEPYNGMTIPISWESEAETVYGGSLDILTGVLTVDKAVITATEFYSYVSSDLTYGRVVLPNALPTVSVATDYITSKFPIDKSAAENTTRRVSGYAYFYFPAGTTREHAESVVNGMQIVYPIADPATYQLTPHEVKSLLGQNNIFTDINSNNILVSYKANIQKCIDNKLNIDETAHRTTSILYGQVDATSTSTKFTATIDGITEYFDGLTILLKNGVVASASGFTIDINGLGAKSVFSSLNITSKETTAFTVTSILTLIYDSTLDDGNGGWIWYKGQDKDTNTVGYCIRTNSKSLPLSSISYGYRLLFTSADRTHYIPANNSNSTNTTSIRDVCQEKIDPFGDIIYYGTTTIIQPENRPNVTTLWLQNAFSLGYSFNRTGQALMLELWKPVYIKATPYSDGSAIIDADEPYVQNLPTTDDEKIYIYLGVAYNTTLVELSLHHPVYYCYNGVIRPWLGFTDSDIVSSVNGKTGTITLTAEDVGAMEGMTILSYGHSTWDEFLEAYEANRIVYCKASSKTNPATGLQGRMAFFAYVQFTSQGYSTSKAEFQYYRSVFLHTDAQQGDQVFCYSLRPENGGTWSVEVRQASSRVIAGTGLSSAYTTDKLTLSLDADYKDKIDTLWADYQSALIVLDGGE